MGQSMRQEADAAVLALTEELSRRIGKGHISALRKAFQAEWGEPPMDLAPEDRASARPGGR